MAGQFGYKSESAWGAGGVVDQFLPPLASTISIGEGHLRPAGIRAGRRTKVPARLGARTVSGQVRFELPNIDIATGLTHMLGTVNTVAGPPHQHTATPGAQKGKSMVIQSVVTDGDDVGRPFTSTGVKLSSWELACQVGQFAELSWDWTGRDVYFHRSVTDGVTVSGDATVTSATAVFTKADLFKPISGTGIPANSFIGRINSATSVELSSSNTVHTSVNASASGTGVTFTLGTAAASASYDAALAPFTFLEGSLSVGGSLVSSARGVRLKANKGLKTDRHALGTRFIREQLEKDMWAFDGSITMDFENMARTINAASADQLALVLAFSNAPDGGTDSLTITSNVQIMGDAPSLTGNGLEEQTVNFEAGHASSDASAITAVLVNGDASAA